MAEKETKTKSQRALELKAKLAALEEEAKTELLETANQTLTELKELGFVYHLVSDAEMTALKAPVTQNLPRTATKKAPSGVSTKPKVSGPSANYEPAKKCPTCDMVGHDGRAHRTRKNKFTEAELAELGLLPPQSDAAQA